MSQLAKEHAPMLQTILCTIGTSIANGCPELGRFQKQGSVWENDTAQLEREIQERLRRFDLASAPGRIAASAELNSLHRLGLAEGNEVVLLASDTADGRACAEALRTTIQRVWPGVRATVERVVGLQVRDAERLRQVGLARLVQIVLRFAEDPQRRYAGGLVLNPTGGFKGVVPFLTVVGMLYQIPTVYVFEFSEALIRLPALPVGFDLQLFLRARPAVSALRAAGGVMPVAKFFATIREFSEEERPQFQSLLEVDGPDATLSPLAEVLAQMEEAGRKTLWLSPGVRERLDASSGLSRKRLEAGLTRLTNPVWRVTQSHRFPNCELHVFGNSHMAFRIAAFFRGDRAYVCGLREITEHDDYEAEFARLKLRDFEHRTDFFEWTPPQTEDELDSAEQSELEELRAQVMSLPESIALETKSLRERIDVLQRRTDQAHSEVRDLKAQVVSLKKQLKHAQRNVASPQLAPAIETTSSMEALSATLEAGFPPIALKGTVIMGTFIEDKRKGNRGGMLIFRVQTPAGAWEGRLPADQAQKLAEIRLGSTVKLRVAGIMKKILQLTLPRS